MRHQQVKHVAFIRSLSLCHGAILVSASLSCALVRLDDILNNPGKHMSGNAPTLKDSCISIWREWVDGRAGPPRECKTTRHCPNATTSKHSKHIMAVQIAHACVAWTLLCSVRKERQGKECEGSGARPLRSRAAAQRSTGNGQDLSDSKLFFFLCVCVGVPDKRNKSCKKCFVWLCLLPCLLQINRKHYFLQGFFIFFNASRTPLMLEHIFKSINI